MIITGQKPGMGWYVCIRCGEDLKLDEDTDVMPPCAKCDGTKFRKVRLICKNCGRPSLYYCMPTLTGLTIDGKIIKVNFCKYCMNPI
jgi:DNA-directed RNA polymerase subunit RPC12/RpoP